MQQFLEDNYHVSVSAIREKGTMDMVKNDTPGETEVYFGFLPANSESLPPE